MAVRLTEEREMRDKATILLEKTKERIMERAKELSSRRIDSRTVVIARRRNIDEVVSRIIKSSEI